MTSIKDILSRGWRNGEIAVAMSSQNGKSVIVDMETQGIEPCFTPGFVRKFPQDHWCHNSKTDQWTFHRGWPYHEYIVGSDKIIARSEDGNFYWYKDRYAAAPRDIDEAELKGLLFVILGAEEVVKNTEWVDVSNFRAKGAGIGSTIP